MNKKPIRLLVWCDYKCTTGFSTVSQNLLPIFQREFGDRLYLDIVAINWHGIKVTEEMDISKVPSSCIVENDEGDEGKVKRIVTIRENDDRTIVTSAAYADGKGDPYGRHIFLSKLKYFDYDGVFIINDLGLVMPLIPGMKQINEEKKKQNRKQFKIIYYFPVDSTPLKTMLDSIHLIDLPVVYTEYGRKEVFKQRPEMRGKLKCILHGVDTKEFFPMEPNDAREFREAYFGDNAGKIIFTNINRNQPRKDIPSTVFSFIAFRKSNLDGFLYLHMDPEDPMGWNLYVLLSQTSLEYGKDYMFMPPDMVKKYPEPGFLNCIYNASDFYITTTSGEGFGLTVLEAMAAGTPVICPAHTSLIELSGFKKHDSSSEASRAWVCDDLIPYVTHYDSIVRDAVDTTKFAGYMFVAAMDKESTKQKAAAALAYAQSLSWKNIGKRWVDELKTIFG
jgi:glycosyltransferase involved in cell wall biosynthesis